MKKYVVPKEDNSGYKLVASHAVPSHAICEVPDHYTREMEPYFVIETITNQGKPQVVCSLSQEWEKHDAEKTQKQFQADLKRMELISKKIKQAEANKVFNSMNPAQRFAKSILGEVAESAKPIIVRSVLKAIFGDKIP